MATSLREKSASGSVAVFFCDEKLRQTSVVRTEALAQRLRAPSDSRNKAGGTAATAATTAADGKLARCRVLQF